MNPSEVCVLDDGRRVRYSLKKRERDPYYLVVFRRPDGVRRERSTKEGNKKRAADSAVAVIRSEHQPKSNLPLVAWDEAVNRLVGHMEGHNLRPQSIRSYKAAIARIFHPYVQALSCAMALRLVGFGVTTFHSSRSQGHRYDRL
ncbi:hypothetical protein BH23PLA1_BH23PLA1_43490 [soil metagenome]